MIIASCSRRPDICQRPPARQYPSFPRYCAATADAHVTGVAARRVGMPDVRRLLAAQRLRGPRPAPRRWLRRSWLTDYLDREVNPLLHGSFRDSVGKALLSAAAILTETVSYMAFDAGEHGLSHRLSI